MDCTAFQRWLEETSRVSPESLPGEYLEHSKKCKTCRTMLAMLQNLRQASKISLVSEARKQEILNSILRNGKASISKPKTEIPTDSLANPLLSWLKWGIAPLGVAFAIFLAVLLLPSGTKVSTTEIQLSGLGTVYRDLAGNKIELNKGAVTLKVPASVYMLASGSEFRVAFADGGNIALRGEGSVIMVSDGFSADNGRFTAKFVRGKNPFKVRVPGAVLGIRGTTVRFDLDSGEKIVELIEGNAEITPIGSFTETVILLPHKPFRLLESSSPASKTASPTSHVIPESLNGISPKEIDKTIQQF